MWPFLLTFLVYTAKASTFLWRLLRALRVLIQINPPSFADFSNQPIKIGQAGVDFGARLNRDVSMESDMEHICLSIEILW